MIMLLLWTLDLSHLHQSSVWVYLEQRWSGLPLEKLRGTKSGVGWGGGGGPGAVRGGGGMVNVRTRVQRTCAAHAVFVQKCAP